MATNPVLGITGSIDNQVPHYDPDAPWKQWNIKEIFFGEIGLHKWVPKVGDWVIDTVLRTTQEVLAIDPFTLLPTLSPVDDNGSGGGLISDAANTEWIAYLDTSVTPHRLSLDGRWTTGGTQSLYCKIFKGVNAGAGSHVVSFLYDQSGNFLTNDIPLEDVVIDQHLNIAHKMVAQCSTRESFADGEILTAVIYTAQNHVVKKASFRVENTGFLRTAGAGTKYISHISLKSPFLSSSDTHKLEYPVNVPLQAFNMTGVVHYSDGSTIELPVDNTRFAMYGLERFIASVPGQDIPLVFKYFLAPGEIAYGNVSLDGKSINMPVRLISTVANNAFTVKLFGYPVWVDNIVGYQLKWFMMDLTREIMFEVTPHVIPNQSSDVWDSLGYHKVQNMSVRLNLKSVSSSFPSYIHTQTSVFVLKEPGTVAATNWLSAADIGQSPFYGEGVFATTHMVNQNLWELKLASGFVDQASWLSNIYTNARPLFDRLKEVAAPVPTHFVVLQGGQRYEYPVTQWSETLQVSATLPATGTIFIEFIRRLPNNGGDLHLAIAGLAIRNI